MNELCTSIEQPEQVKSESETAEKTARNDSKQSKRGGRRAGAGRPPNLAKRLAATLKPMSAADILEHVDVPGVFQDIFKKGSRSLKLQAVNALWDRAFGKPKQEVVASGSVSHVHRRDDLASLPKEALEALARAYDDVLAKHSAPVLDAAPKLLENQSENEANHVD